MDIAHLKEFVTLASHLKLSTAARELYMSPSTLSQHITALEKEVGCELFSRRDGLALTRRGEATVEHAQKILFEYETLLRDCSPNEGRILRLSVPNYYFGQAPVAAAREAYLAAHPGTKVILTTNECQGKDPFEILEDGSSNTAGLYLIRGSDQRITAKLPEGVRYIPFPSFRCVFISTDRHPLAHKPVLTTVDLDGATITLKLCPVSSTIMDGVSQVLLGYGALVRVLFRHVTRNTDAFLGDIGDQLVQWFEPLDHELEPPAPGTVVHRFEHELVADSYLLYRPDQLDELQLAYLDAVRDANARWAGRPTE